MQHFASSCQDSKQASGVGHLPPINPLRWLFLNPLQVNGGSQSFNVVNTLRVLGRWMRMFTIPNQSSVPKVRGSCIQCCSTC